MAKSFWVVLWLAAITVAASVAVLFPGEWTTFGLMTAGALACIGGSALVLGWPAGLAFIETRTKTVRVVGVSVLAACALGFVVVILASLNSPSVLNTGLTACTMVGLMGIMIFSLPRMATQMATARSAMAAIKAPGAKPPAFGGIREGLRSPIRVVRDWRAFLQIAGPWALLMSAGLVAGVITGNNLNHDRAKATMLLWGVLVLLLGLVASIPIVAVAWHRWIVDGRLPKRFVALPDSAMWGYLFRLWLFGAALGTIDRWISPNVAALALSAHLPNAGAIGDVAGNVADVLAIMLVSSVALRLPAIAVGDRDFVLSVASIQGRKMWPGLPLGLVLSIVPFYFLGWAFDQGYDAFLKPKASSSHMDWASAASLGLGLFVAYATVASVATYLSKAYIAAKTTMK
jgi:hypothetical protein